MWDDVQPVLISLKKERKLSLSCGQWRLWPQLATPGENFQCADPKAFPGSAFPLRVLAGLQSTLTQGRQPWGLDPEDGAAKPGYLSRRPIRPGQAAWTWVLAKTRPQMNSCGLKIPMQEQSFLRIRLMCFWQNLVSFFEGEKKNGVGKCLEISQDLLDTDDVLQNTFLTS